MTVLSFAITGAAPAPGSAAPAVTFRLRIRNETVRRVHALALRSVVRIEPRGRRYDAAEQRRLYELFGDPSQWDRTLNAVTWAQPSILVPAFDEVVDVDVPVACTYDLDVASAKYLHAIRGGDVPLLFLFSGTIFTIPAEPSRPAQPAPPALPAFSIEPIPWTAEATFRMPAEIWHNTMDRFFPGGGWLRLRRDTIDRLQAFRGRQAVVGWDDAIDLLLRQAEVGEAV